ncbi:MAG: hypothetical protein LUC85_00440 [Bacteroidales bacterium]|nr:hypothetical protein [Bacteroidales bacterium]
MKTTVPSPTPTTSTENKRIARNSVTLYLRTAIILIVGLYTSRVVLEVLGIDDYGVFSVVGSLMTVFMFFTMALGSSFSRFFAFELGKADDKRLHEVFGATIAIICVIGLIIVVLTETVGLWVFCHLDIPPESRDAAWWVYQCSVATVLLSVVQTAYTSSLIAHEKMGAWAMLDIVTACLKLGVVFALKWIATDKLVLYGVLILAVSIIVTITGCVYTRVHCPEWRGRVRWDWPVIKSMLGFSSWSLYTTLCNTLRPAGINVVLNLAFGVAVNAAAGIGLNVMSNVQKFAYSAFLSFKPQIIKKYAAMAFDEMQRLMDNAFRIAFTLQLLVVIPLILEMPMALRVWLGEYPAYSVVFCRLLVVSLTLEIIVIVCEFGINATGRLKLFSLFNSTLFMLTVPLAWLSLKVDAYPPLVYVTQIIVVAACCLGDLLILKKLVPQLSIKRFCAIFLRVGVVAAVGVGVALAPWLTMEESWARLLAVVASSLAGVAAAAWFLLLPEDMRLKIKSKLPKCKVLSLQ